MAQASSHVTAHRGVWKPLSVSRVWNVHGTCLLAVRLLFFLHRHDDVTPSWFSALESYVLRVPAGNEIKLWSSPPSPPTPSLWSDLWLLHWAALLFAFYCATTASRHVTSCPAHDWFLPLLDSHVQQDRHGDGSRH